MATNLWGASVSWNDTIASAAGAYAIAEDGTPTLSPELAEAAPLWLVEDANGQAVPNRFPGAMYVAAPMYALLGGPFSLLPSLIVAMLTTAAGAVLLGFSRVEVIGVRGAVVTSLILGLCTPAWGLASRGLWTHGPVMLWIGAAFMLLSYGRDTWAGVLLGVAVFTRPPLAVMVLVSVLHLAVARRDWSVVWRLGVSSWGAFAYLAYNRVLFGHWTLTGGYGDQPTSRLRDLTLSRYGTMLWGGILSPARGFVVQTPLVLAAVRPAVWRRSPDWLRSFAIGAVAYVAFTWAADGYSGGGGQMTYRYSLPLVIMLILLAMPELLRSTRRWVLPVLAAAGAAVQAATVLTVPGPPVDELPLPWGDWSATTGSQWVLAAAAGALLGGAVWLALRPSHPRALVDRS